MTLPSIERALRNAVADETERRPTGDEKLTYRLHDLAKHLAAELRLEEAGPLMRKAALVAIRNGDRRGQPRAPDKVRMILDKYELLLKMIRSATPPGPKRLHLALDRARVRAMPGGQSGVGKSSF